MSERLPIFALHSVLMPGGTLTLQVFETRYLDMVSACMREERPFAVNLIHQGREVGDAAEVFPTGTTARVVDWTQLPNGLLGLTLLGERRFHGQALEADARQLLSCAPEWLPEDKALPLREHDEHLASLLLTLSQHPSAPLRVTQELLDDAAWVGWRLTERLPVPLELKQQVLQLDEPYERLDLLHRTLRRLA